MGLHKLRFLQRQLTRLRKWLLRYCIFSTFIDTIANTYVFFQYIFQPGAKVGVNCFGGFSRSTCSVVAYMVLKKNMQADEALRILIAKVFKYQYTCVVFFKDSILLQRDVHPSAQNLAHLARLSNGKHGFESDPADLEFDLAEYRKLSQLPGGSNDKSAKK